MLSVRNWYIYIVCALTINATAWAAIDILRSLLIERDNILGVAGSIAMLIVALPVFLIHWLWAQRLAAGDTDEASAFERSLYLNGITAGFLGPAVGYSFATLVALLFWLFGVTTAVDGALAARTPAQNVIYFALPAIVTALFWRYKHGVLIATNRLAEAQFSRALQRVVRLGFAIAGVAVLVLGSAQLLVLLLSPFVMPNTPVMASATLRSLLLREVARIAIGLALWLLAWRSDAAAPQPTSPNAPAFRVWYHQIVVVGLTLAAVGALAIVLRSLLEAALGVLEGTLAQALLTPLAALTASLPLLGWHAAQLPARADLPPGGDWSAAAADRAARTLVAAVGLAALLGGLAGVLTILINPPADATFGRTQLATYVAALAIGIAVWLWRWPALQRAAHGSDPAAAIARNSVVRQIYLYMFMLGAIVTILASTVYIVTQLVRRLLGDTFDVAGAELAQALAYTLLAAVVLIYHTRLLNADRQQNAALRATRLAGVDVALFQLPEAAQTATLAQMLRERLPGLALHVIDPRAADEAAVAQVAASRIVIMPAGPDAPGAALASALQASSAVKFLLPAAQAGWRWLGNPPDGALDLYRATAQAVEQAAQGEDVQMRRPLGFLAIVGLIVCVFILLNFLGLILGGL